MAEKKKTGYVKKKAFVMDPKDRLPRDKHGHVILGTGWIIKKIPEGVCSLLDIDENGNAKPKTEEKRQAELKRRPAPKRKPAGGAKIAMSDVEKALGKGYVMEPDRSYKCRRWVVTKNTREWRIRFNGKLDDAIKEIKKDGAAVFLKKYSKEGR